MLASMVIMEDLRPLAIDHLYLSVRPFTMVRTFLLPCKFALIVAQLRIKAPRLWLFYDLPFAF